MRTIGIIEEIERLKLIDKEHLINELIHAKVEISYLKAINSDNDELKRCNSDYYNQINTLTSKLARIREACEFEMTNTDALQEEIMDIINDKNIVIGSDKK